MSEELAPEKRKANSARGAAIADVESRRKQLSLSYANRFGLMRIVEERGHRAPFTRKEVLQECEQAHFLAECYDLDAPPFIGVPEVMSSEESQRALHMLLVWYASQIKELSAQTTLSPSPSPEVAKGGRGATVNARMMDAYQQDPDRRWWSAVKWAGYLRCGKTTVINTKAWGSLKLLKAEEKIDQAERRKQRRKAG